jgi:hypothetical protein
VLAGGVDQALECRLRCRNHVLRMALSLRRHDGSVRVGLIELPQEMICSVEMLTFESASLTGDHEVDQC